MSQDVIEHSKMNKVALVRGELDVPIIDAKVQDLGRLENIVPTINFLLKRGYRVIIFGHMGRPSKQGNVAELSTKQLVPSFENIFQQPVKYCSNAELAKNSNANIVMLENTRFDPREEQNSIELAQEYAQLGDIYVNESFSVSHREHASMLAITQLLPSYMGLHLQSEVTVMDEILNNPKKPLVGIVGGAKVSDKLQITKKLINICDQVLIGGAMMFTFLLAKGLKVGKSLSEPDFVEEAGQMLKTGKIVLPLDVVTGDSIVSNGDITDAAKNISTVSVDSISDQSCGYDIGPESVKEFSKYINAAQTILWNGPMGMVEVAPFEQGTAKLAELVSQSKAYSVVGGGDSVAVIKKLGFESKMSHISSGGGAMLEYIEKGTLPTLKNLKLLETL